MKTVKFNVFPHGKNKAVTFSYDDGRSADYRLTELFDKYGAKCTFNLNSSFLGDGHHIDRVFSRELAQRHEIACHTWAHPFITKIPQVQFLKELLEDKKMLEDIAGQPIVGMAYPFGQYTEAVKETLRAAGIEYCRTVDSIHTFDMPTDFLEWNPSCHHSDAAPLITRFNGDDWDNQQVLYIWGHSYEFDDHQSWDSMVRILEELKDRDYWFATNLELHDYVTAVRRIRLSYENESAYNPSAISVYARVDGKVVEVKPGLTVF